MWSKIYSHIIYLGPIYLLGYAAVAMVAPVQDMTCSILVTWLVNIFIGKTERLMAGVYGVKTIVFCLLVLNILEGFDGDVQYKLTYYVTVK